MQHFPKTGLFLEGSRQYQPDLLLVQVAILIIKVQLQRKDIEEEKPVIRRSTEDRPIAADRKIENDFGDPQLRMKIEEMRRLEAEDRQAGIDLRKEQRILERLQAVQRYFEQQKYLQDYEVREIYEAYLLARQSCSSQYPDLPKYSEEMINNWAIQRNNLIRQAQLDHQIETTLQLIIKAKEQNRKLRIAEQERKGKIRVFCRIRPLASQKTRGVFFSEDEPEDLILKRTKPQLHDPSPNPKAAATSRTRRIQQSQPHNDHPPNLKPNSKCVSLPKQPQFPKQNLSSMAQSQFSFKSIASTSKDKTLLYKFDGIFSQSAGQEQVFMEFEPVVSLAVEGKEVCLFSYGQTGSGNTYTMLGSKSNHAIAYRALRRIFLLIREQQEIGWEWRVKMSADELNYQGKLDLISKRKLGLKERLSHFVETQEDAFQFLWDSIKNRTTSKIDENTQSSRSHFFLTVEIELRMGEKTRNGALSIIDLAGSESAMNTTNMDQTIFINSTLASLTSYFDFLHKNLKINAQDTPLTIALQDHLKKDTFTLIVVCVSADLDNFAQSRRAAIFGTNARATVKKE